MSTDERLSLIEKDVSYIVKFIDEDRKKMYDHITSSEIFRNKVIKLGGVENNLKEHIVTDRWMFGTIITLLICIIGALARILMMM